MSNIAIPWKDVDPKADNPVRNTGSEYLKFLNTAVFSEEARHFLRTGYYTNAPYGSKDYNDYWDEQEKRCLRGYSVGGVRITGRHYYYLNFTLMRARPIDPDSGLEKTGAGKILTFPRFLDHQYYLFNEIEECIAEGPHIGKERKGLVILKSRRKGLTYCISNGLFGYNFNFIPSSTNVLGAYEKQHYMVTLDGIHFGLNHINKHTDWAKRKQKLNKRDHFRASFMYKDENGVEVEDGYMSEVLAISFKDNEFKGIGLSASLFGIEEAGKFNNLLNTYAVSIEPLIRDGDITTGFPVIWGSAGDMEGGSTGLSEMFYNPTAYGLKAYENIYDENATGECGYFIDDLWYLPGTYMMPVYFNGKKVEKKLDMLDVQGNSIRDVALESLLAKREIRKKGNKDAYYKFITQQPLTPSEALLRTQGNMFDAVRAQLRLSYIETNPAKLLDTIYRCNLALIPDTGEIRMELNTSVQPVYEFPLKDNKNKPGIIEVYEPPIRNSDGQIPPGLFIFAIDSYDDDASETNSLGSMIVLNRLTDRIVAHYKGRPLASKFYENCRRLAKYYNARGVYERRNKGIYGYFYNTGSLHLLAEEPDILKEKGISKANTIGNNALGIAPSTAVNSYGRELALKWMSSKAYGEPEDSEITNMDKIRSIPILKEIIAWNSEGNFDDISALGLLMIYREDRSSLRVNPDNKIVIKSANTFWDKFSGENKFSKMFSN